MYYILKENIKDLSVFIEKLKEHYLTRSIYSCKQKNVFGIATYFCGTETRKYILLTERMCDSDPHISWITSRKKCESEEEFLQKVDEKIKQQIKNRTW